MKEEVVFKTPKERDDFDLLELVCELRYPNEEMHRAYREAREELEARLRLYSTLTPTT